jgi:hypothetical protein
MSLFIRILGLIGAVGVATALNGTPQRTQRPSISYGGATISLGMTVEEVERHLADAARHLKTVSDKDTALVYLNGVTDDFEGQITFSTSRHVIYADFHMPNVHSADELAEEIAGAVDSMETKTCEASNYSTHGTGGGLSQSIFECGTRRSNVMTTQVFGSNMRTINVNIEIGQTVAK